MGWSGNTFTRTNGTHTGTSVWQQDRDAGTKIVADRHDTNDNDLATGINTCINKTGANAFTGNANLGSQKITALADGTAHTDGVNAGQIQDGGLIFQATDSGSADAYAIALSPAITAYVAGQEFTFKAGATSTGASTLNVNGVGVKNIKKKNDQAIAAGDIEANAIIKVFYDGTSFQMLSQTATGGMTSFTLTGDSGSNQTIADSNTMDVAGGTGISTVVGATDTVTVSVDSTVKLVGKETIWIPAVAMYPNTTNGCAAIAQTELSNGPEIKTLDFATGADDFAQFSIAFPKSWNEGTVTFQPFWTVTGTNTGTVAWALSGIAVTNDATINTAFGTAAVTTALAHSGTSNDLMVSVESGAITIAGSPSTDDVCFFQISRDVSADNQSGAARLIGLKVFFTTDAGNDA